MPGASASTGLPASHGFSGRIASRVRGECLSAYPNYHNRPGLIAGTARCAGGFGQAWVLPGDNTIRSGGRCLDAAGTASGTGVVIAECDGSGGQFWETDDVAGIPGDELLNPRPGKCMTDPRSSRVNDTQVLLSPCNRSTPQIWYFGASGSSGSSGSLSS